MVGVGVGGFKMHAWNSTCDLSLQLKLSTITHLVSLWSLRSLLARCPFTALTEGEREAEEKQHSLNNTLELLLAAPLPYLYTRRSW